MTSLPKQIGKLATPAERPIGGGRLPDTLTEWFWETDTEHRFTYVSMQSGFTTGLQVSEVIGRKREDIAADRDDAKWESHRADLAARRPFRGFEYAVEGPDGSITFISVSGEPRFDADGIFLGYRGATSDVTQRRMVERELRRARQLFQAVLDQAPLAIAIKDKERRYIEVSREWERRYGFARADVLGKLPSEIFPADAAAEYEADDRQVLRDGRELVREERLVRPAGDNEYYLTSSFPTLNRDGEAFGMGVISVDISARKQAELALAESEQQLRIIADNLPVVIARFDRQGRLEFANRVAEEWLGRPAAQIVGKTLRELFGEEDYATIEPWVNQALAGDRTCFQGTVRYPGGTIRDVEGTYVPEFGPDGAVRGCVALVNDISARKAAERRLQESETQTRTIADNLPALVAYVSSDLHFRFVNRTTEEWYGRPASDILGRRLDELIVPDIYSKLLPRIRDVLAGRRVGFELDLPYPDGRIRAVDIAWIPDIDEDGHVRGWFSLVTDITERKRLEAQLLRRERLAALGQLTGTVAHELRNPLGAIAASVAALRRKSADAHVDMERSLARAERGIARCDRIVTELLDFARAKGLQREPTRFAHWLKAILDEYELPDGIELALEVDPCNVEVMIDREELRRAAINILDNACQALGAGHVGEEEGRGRIEIVCRIAEHRLCWDIRDNGPGIPQECLDRVLEPLFSTKSFGTGLGLPTVQRIMEDHNGGIRIESETGKGAQVRLWLPLGVEQAKGAGNAEPENTDSRRR